MPTTNVYSVWPFKAQVEVHRSFVTIEIQLLPDEEFRAVWGRDARTPERTEYIFQIDAIEAVRALGDHDLLVLTRSSDTSVEPPGGFAVTMHHLDAWHLVVDRIVGRLRAGLVKED